MTAQGHDGSTATLVLPDPEAAVLRQFAADKAHMAWKPELLARKHARMRASSFSYLRGSASVYYELLAACPPLADGPAGDGWIVGDLHLENFGAYRGAEPHPVAGGDVVFNLNDFDDAVQAPWRWDVLRLLTSVLLAARERGIEGVGTVGLARQLITAYAHVLGTGKAPHEPAIVTKLVKRTSDRDRVEFLDSRTEIVKKERHFIRGERYDDLAAATLAAVPQALKEYSSVDGAPRPPEDHLELIDAAFRIAGTGSLGCRRIAALTVGKGGPDGCWIFDIKEEGAPSAEVLLGPQTLAPNVRVATAARTCVPRPVHMLGTTTLQGRPMLVRRFMPQEDKIDVSTLKLEEFESITPYFGALAALAHLRGAHHQPSKPWSEKECELLLSRATLVAGWHEAAYLAFCRVLSLSDEAEG